MVARQRFLFVEARRPIRNHGPAHHGAPVQASSPGQRGRRIARNGCDPGCAPQHPLPPRLYRLAGAYPRLAWGRTDELCRPCRREPPLRSRLPGRRPVLSASWGRTDELCRPCRREPPLRSRLPGRRPVLSALLPASKPKCQLQKLNYRKPRATSKQQKGGRQSQLSMPFEACIVSHSSRSNRDGRSRCRRLIYADESLNLPEHIGPQDRHRHHSPPLGDFFGCCNARGDSAVGQKQHPSQPRHVCFRRMRTLDRASNRCSRRPA
jgi:hypothetical protein